MSANIVKPEPSSNLARALVLFASPHKSGSTAGLLNAFLSPLRGRIKMDCVSAYELNAGPCTACGYCRSREGCANADLDFLDALYRAANLIIVASPVYNLGFPAPMKAILDRFQRYFEARFSLNIRPSIPKPKRAVLLACCGREDGAGVMERQLEMVFSVMNTRLDTVVVLQNTDRANGAEQEEAYRRAEKAAIAILNDMCYDKV